MDLDGCCLARDQRVADPVTSSLWGPRRATRRTRRPHHPTTPPLPEPQHNAVECPSHEHYITCCTCFRISRPGPAQAGTAVTPRVMPDAAISATAHGSTTMEKIPNHYQSSFRPKSTRPLPIGLCRHRFSPVEVTGFPAAFNAVLSASRCFPCDH